MQDRDESIELLSTHQMAEADRLTIEAGTAGAILMDRAGSAVADQCRAMLPDHLAVCVLVLCGPGNNGGDGFVAARRLRACGHTVRLALLGERQSLAGDAAEAARGWLLPVEAAASASFEGVGLIVDALFGAGLSRPLSGEAAALVERVNSAGIPVLAVDIPSGIDGNTGVGAGPAIWADRTVTFFRFKPGHLLLPGRAHCGTAVLADIGIDPEVLDSIAPRTFANCPALWASAYPWPRREGHKYMRGHALVLSGGPTTTGAARLSARAALRTGAGLVTLASPSGALAVNGAHLTAVMLKPCDSAADLAGILADRRKNAVVLGPGLGIGATTCALVEQALAPQGDPGAGRATVLDADALMSFAGAAAKLRTLIEAAPGPVVVTPHDGEFARLFEGEAMIEGSRLDRARAGAARLGAIMLLKGADTVIAEPDGRASIAGLDAPWLATAGSGDVLAGLIGGLLAQGMPAFEAASAAVHLHAAAARHIGYGLIAEDLPEALPAVLTALHGSLGSAEGLSRSLHKRGARE
jgi:NAD(P)H-hydrate epimerase